MFLGIRTGPPMEERLRRGGAKRPCCYDSMLKVLSKELTLILSDTRELDRVLNTK